MKNLFIHINYRKPLFWISAVVLIAILFLSVPLLSNAIQPKTTSSVTSKEPPMKGLELYIWKNAELTGNDGAYFTLLIGTNRNKVEDEIYDLGRAVDSIDKVNALLDTYSEETFLFIYQMNTTDFTKTEMQAIAEKLDFPKGGNGSTAIGLWQQALYPEETVSKGPSISEATSISKEASAIIGKKLEIILSSPLHSSNSQDYINAHQEEYQTILKYGDTALDYLLLQFRTGENNNGLRGIIMMGLCKQLLGDRNNVTDPTLLPQAWFDALLIRTEMELSDFPAKGFH